MSRKVTARTNVSTEAHERAKRCDAGAELGAAQGEVDIDGWSTVEAAPERRSDHALFMAPRSLRSEDLAHAELPLF